MDLTTNNHCRNERCKTPADNLSNSSSNSNKKGLSPHNSNDIGFASCCNPTLDTSTNQQGDQCHNELSDSLSFFNETLDLSQEDIQRTLIANMPFASDVKNEVVVGDVSPVLNHIDFIENACSDNATGRQSCRVRDSAHHHEEDTDADDVFVNLDAFDMLVEFPELDFDEKQNFVSSHSSNSNDHTKTASSELNELQFGDMGSTKNTNECTKKLLNITDYCPEWSYPEGGIKVLVTGPWSSSSSYTVLFDSLPVQTILVQEGVLRCYCPAHEVGFATLQVSCESVVISNSVMFEYKTSPCPEAPFDSTSNDCLYKFTLLNRLSSINEKMQIKTEQDTLVSIAENILFLNFMILKFSRHRTTKVFSISRTSKSI